MHGCISPALDTASVDGAVAWCSVPLTAVPSHAARLRVWPAPVHTAQARPSRQAAPYCFLDGSQSPACEGRVQGGIACLSGVQQTLFWLLQGVWAGARCCKARAASPHLSA
jgi:hypothetical protein